MKLLARCLAPMMALAASVASVGMGGPSFVRYPGYAGQYNITGTVDISDDPTAGLYHFLINLSGGEPNTNHLFHIHAGVSCAAASDVGGHFWRPFTDPDPWVDPTLMLMADASGNIATSIQLSFGYTSDLFIGHAVVVHHANNARAACSLITATNINAVPLHETAVMGPYPNYTGTLNATGSVDVWDLNGTYQVVNFRLAGLNPNATGGVHIHVGKTCATSGPHYWTPQTAADPWTTTYSSNYLGVAEGSFLIASGYLLADNIHHALVVHDGDANKTRIGCGALGGLLVGSVTQFGIYPGYNGAMNNVSGSVSISYEPTKPSSYRFDIALSGAPTSSNMAFHIHAGLTCANASRVGGHFWAPFLTPDPWVPNLVSDANGNVHMRLDVAFGYTHEQFIGHAVVVHSSDNTRIACSLIGDAMNSNAIAVYQEAVLDTYPGYNGTRAVKGSIQVRDLDATRQVVNFLLTGLNSNTSGGVHIHEGMTCANASGHYWTPKSAADPWASTTYTSNAAGLAEGSFIIASGYLLADNIHHAVVVHDADVTRLACGLLGGQGNTDTTNTTCPQAAIKATFDACKVYDFSGTSHCTQACSDSLKSLIAAFKAQNTTDAASVSACLDMINATHPWVNGALSTLKQRINFNGVALCNSTNPDSISGAAALSSFLAFMIPVFALF